LVDSTALINLGDPCKRALTWQRYFKRPSRSEQTVLHSQFPATVNHCVDSHFAYVSS